MIYSYIWVKKADSRGSGRSSTATITDYRLEIFESNYGPQYGTEKCLIIEGKGNHSNMWGSNYGTYATYEDRLKVHIGKEDLKKMIGFALDGGLLTLSDIQIFLQNEND
jgi:hypothetical protein